MPILSFQQGVNGYTGTVDTMLRQAAPTTSYAGTKALSADSSDPGTSGQPSQGLLQFTNLFGSSNFQIPVGATITRATLALQTTDSGDGATLHRMLTPWAATNTWTTFGGGSAGGIQANGIEAMGAADRLTGKMALGASTFDVTTSVQAWADGAANRGGAANNGWAFLPSGTNGWDFSSAEGSTKPKLTIEYSLSSLAAPNSAPVVTPDSGPLAYAENASPTTVSPLLNISDLENTGLIGATVRIAPAGYAADQDRLVFTDQAGIAGAWNGGAGTLTLSGRASVPAYETALSSVQYVNASENPSAAVRAVEFQVNDGASANYLSAVASRAIQVAPVNDAPTAAPDAYATTAGTALTVGAATGLLANDRDLDGAVLTAIQVTSPAHGGLTLNADGSFGYVPTRGYVGSDSFSYKVHDGTAEGNTTTVDLTIAPPAPQTHQATFQQGSNGYFGVADTKIRFANATTSYATAISLGTDGDDPAGTGQDEQSLLQFANLFGTDPGQIPAGATVTRATLTLQTTDNGDGAALHRMLKPWAATDTWATFGSGTEGGIQANGIEAAAASDVRAGPLPIGASAIDVTASVQAWAGGQANDGWALLPLGNNGWDFASGEGTTQPKLVVDYTTPSLAAGAPVALDDTAMTKQDTPVAVAVLANDTDADGDPLVVEAIATGPAHGSAAIAPDGSTILYTPDAAFLGDDSFIYSVTDGQGGTDTAVVSITVTSRGLPAFAATASPTVETAAVAGSDDVADDPAIWVDRTDPGRSVVIGTDKDPSQGRLYVFDLQGNVVSTTPAGSAFNNVDIVYGVDLGGRPVDLVGASNRTTGSIDFFAIDPETRSLSAVGSVATELSHLYGFTMAKAGDGKAYAYVSTTGPDEDSSVDTLVRQFEIEGSSGSIRGTPVRTLSPGPQVEGMVVDDRSGTLYLAQEDVGIWKYGADPAAGSTRTLVDAVGNSRLTADVEGLTIYEGPNGTGYLIASSQGSSTYAVYDRSGSNPYLGSFRVADGGAIDGATKTDGLDVTHLALGPSFPNGVFVVHDNANAGASSSNFKLVPWESIAVPGGLMMDTTDRPHEGWLF